MNIKLLVLLVCALISVPYVLTAEQSSEYQRQLAQSEQTAAAMKAQSEKTAAEMKAQSKKTAAEMKAQSEKTAAEMKAQSEKIAAWFKAQSEQTAAWFKAQSEKTATEMKAQSEKTTAAMKAQSEKTAASIQKTDSLENVNFLWEATKYSVGFILDLAPLEWFGGVPAYIGTTLPILEVIKGGNTIEKAQNSAQLFKDRNIQVIDELYSNRLNVRQTLDMEARTRFGNSVTWLQLTDDKKNQIIEYSGGWDDFLMSICGGSVMGCAGPKVVWDALGKP